jgi:hypothetical protein
MEPMSTFERLVLRVAVVSAALTLALVTVVAFNMSDTWI